MTEVLGDTPGVLERVTAFLGDLGVAVRRTEVRSFPGERWIIVQVDPSSLAVAQSAAGPLEADLNSSPSFDDANPYAVTFRPFVDDAPSDTEDDGAEKSGIKSPAIDQLIKLLEARSRTSDALPSLKYVADPRASLAAATATRHQIIYGRRGVGKTALLVESKRLAEGDGSATVWVNAQVLRRFSAEQAFVFLADSVLVELLRHAGTSDAPIVRDLRDLLARVEGARSDRDSTSLDSQLLADLNSRLRRYLRFGVSQLVVYIDDFYLYDLERQALLLDFLAAVLRDCNGWIKVASIERLTRPYEPSTQVGLEVPHDATKIDLDVTLEDPVAAQTFLETVLSHYTSRAGVGTVSGIANTESLGRLVLASGGVPRDYLNLVSNSISVARERPKAREIGKEDVAVASGAASRSKKRDLELDVSSEESAVLLSSLDRLSGSVKGAGFTYFRIDTREKTSRGYEILSRLVDLRFAHLIQSVLSDKHAPGVKYECYVLALTEYTDVRLKRGLQVLDLEGGAWTHRQSGKAKTKSILTGTKFRDKLRLAPIVDLNKLEEQSGKGVLRGEDAP